MNTQIPSDIAEIIEKKRQALLEERKQKQEREERALKETRLQGEIKLNEYISQSILKVPEFICPYFAATLINVDYERLARGWDRVEQIKLYFSIPGLALIQFDPKDSTYRSQHVVWDDWRDDSKPEMSFDSGNWEADLELVLGQAREAIEEFEESITKHQVRQEAIQKERESREHEEQEREALAVESANQRQLKEQSEEQALFDAIKNDPIAIHLLKAFILLRDERSYFEQRLEDANDSLYSMENRWSRRAEELRRQADEAQRRADDEKYRLQSDLDDAEAKLKKAQRGW